MRICFLFFSVEWGCKSKGATYALMDIYDLIIIIVTVYLFNLISSESVLKTNQC